MKKLLCVLMFGFVLSQDAITKREYTLTITQDTESIDVTELLGYSIEGIIEIDIINIENIDIPDDCGTFAYDDMNAQTYTIQLKNLNAIISNYSNISIGFGVNHGGCNTYVGASNNRLILNSNNREIYVEPSSEYGDNFNFSFIATITISGKFPSDDVGLQGDMNDDGELDVLDVVSLVQEILSGGMGDVGDLLNIVTG